MSKYWSKLCCLKGVGSLRSQISREGGSSTNDSWCQKTRVPGLSRGVVCVKLRLAVLIQYRRVTYRQTDRHTHDDGYYPRIACAERVKTARVCVCVCAHHCAQLSYTIQQTTILIISSLILRTVVIAQRWCQLEDRKITKLQ